MQNFFIHVDTQAWEHYFLPAFCEHLEDAPDTVDHLIEIIKEYVLFRHETVTNICQGIVDGAQETPLEITGLVLDNENITYVDVNVFAQLLETFYQSVHVCMMNLGDSTGMLYFTTHQQNETLYGFSGSTLNSQL